MSLAAFSSAEVVPAACPLPRRGVRALIVDDDSTNRLVLRLMLEKHKYEVIVAVNGLDAVEKFSQCDPDIVLMDLMMPEMNGYEATRLIKFKSAGNFVPIIFLTATADEKALTACVEAGGDDFMSKPYSHALLKAKIDAQLRNRALHQTLQEQKKQLELHEETRTEEFRIAERIFSRISRQDHLSFPNVRRLMLPMAVLNGDLILATQRPGGGQIFLVGDMTGHGLPAAVGGMMVFDVFYSMAAKGFSIADIVPEINRKLLQVLPTGRFLAVALIELDEERRCVTVWNGGMPDIYVWNQNTPVEICFPSTHFPLGVVPNSDLDVKVQSVELPAGSRILAFSDGLLETHNAAGDMFGVERLLECMKSVSDGERLFDEVVQSVDRFRSDAEQSDDLTLLEIACEPDDLSTQVEEVKQVAFRKPPMAWRLALELGPDALRHADPLPMMLQFLTDLQGLEEHREKLYLVLTELYSNALEHGVLELDSAMKRSPDGFADYYRARSDALNALREGRVTIECEHIPGADKNRLLLRLSNSGNGSDWTEVATKLETNKGFSGRGLALIRSLCDDLEYSENGTRAQATYSWVYTAPGQNAAQMDTDFDDVLFDSPTGDDERELPGDEQTSSQN